MKKANRLFALILIVMFLWLLFNLPFLLRRLFPLHYSALIVHYAGRMNVDPALAAAVISVESAFQVDAVSPKGAVGLMQLMPETASWLAEQKGRDFSPAELLQPEANIELGVQYLEYLLALFSTDFAALAAYNAGPANVSRWLEKDIWDGSWQRTGHIPFGETRSFVRKVEFMRRIYRFLYGKELKYGEESGHDQAT